MVTFKLRTQEQLDKYLEVFKQVLSSRIANNQSIEVRMKEGDLISPQVEGFDPDNPAESGIGDYLKEFEKTIITFQYN